jgi:hypothetical protein
MAPPKEQDEMKKKISESRKFFDEMESNILRTMKGETVTAPPKIDIDSDSKSRRSGKLLIKSFVGIYRIDKTEKSSSNDPYFYGDDIEYDDFSDGSKSPSRYEMAMVER